MLMLTRLNGTQFYVNADLILIVEETPNTVITLMDHSKLVVKESPAEIIDRVLQYKRKIYQPLQSGNCKNT